MGRCLILFLECQAHSLAERLRDTQILPAFLPFPCEKSPGCFEQRFRQVSEMYVLTRRSVAKS
jgi:hypothetical protein